MERSNYKPLRGQKLLTVKKGMTFLRKKKKKKER